MDEIIVRFTQEDYEEYIEEWKKLNPRRSKLPINKPMCPSLNELLVIRNSKMRNDKKQDFKKYTMWVCKKYGVDMKGINECDLEITFQFPTLHNHDIDNYVGGSKFILDGFTECGLLVADDYKHLQSITGNMEYIKSVTGMIFRFYNCKYDLDKLKIEMEKEQNKASKCKATKESNKKAKPKKKKKSSKNAK